MYFYDYKILTVQRKLLYLLFLIIMVAGCKKSSDLPDVPIITFKEFRQYQYANGKDSIGVMVFDFTDGDGDLGYREKDTLPPFDKKGQYYYNFRVKYFERQKGIFKEIKLPFDINARIPYLTPEGKNKVLSGNIAMSFFINNPFSTYDTIRFEAYIYDRALNKSNVIQTRDIIVNK